MKSADIVQQLAGRLPQLSAYFATDIALTGIRLTAESDAVLVTCGENHVLSAEDSIFMSGVRWDIDIATFTRVGAVGTIVTSADHDLTLPIAATVTTNNANEAKFNGTFTTINVVNRRTITVEMTDADEDTATGTPRLLNASSAYQNFNGLHQVSVAVDATHFEYVADDLTNIPRPADASGITAQKLPRIASAATREQVVLGYTKQDAMTDAWLFVLLDDVYALSDNRASGEAVSSLTRADNYRQQIVQPFTLILALRTTELVSGGDARDVAEELLLPICQSVLWKAFDSQLSAGEQNPVHFVRHGLIEYNGPAYFHAYEFEQIVDITVDDTVGAAIDVAFRDITLEIAPDLGGTGSMTADVDLDDTPL